MHISVSCSEPWLLIRTISVSCVTWCLVPLWWQDHTMKAKSIQKIFVNKVSSPQASVGLWRKSIILIWILLVWKVCLSSKGQMQIILNWTCYNYSYWQVHRGTYFTKSKSGSWSHWPGISSRGLYQTSSGPNSQHNYPQHRGWSGGPE